jgi:hypothetical protein
LRKNPTPKEIRYAKKMGFELIEADCRDFLEFVNSQKA